MAFCKAIARRSQKVTVKNDHLDVKFFFGQQVFSLAGNGISLSK